MTNKIFNYKNFESFLTMNGENHSFDHNDEADYLLSNINSPKNSTLINNTLLNNNRYEGWIGQNPLYKFPNENTHWDNNLNENTHEILLKYLNSVNFDRNTQTFDDCKFLDYILNDNVFPPNYIRLLFNLHLNYLLKENKIDNLNDVTKSFEKLKFTESKLNLPDSKFNLPDSKFNLPEPISKLSESKLNLSDSKLNLPETKLNLSEQITKLPETNTKFDTNTKYENSTKYENGTNTKYETGVRGRLLGFEDLRVEKDDYSSYIMEGTGTILKIIEASQLWLNHTSSEKIPLKIKKQFTKNDNFVILIKKQFTHY
ncbi:uncharacterized protein TA08995 [Theileria annulata]|uniref:Uncharacterized protein n=1 Tax=Theileria annulata TaxID=5874 RepID=Q4UAI2_THEAN|nr:uncharacterized protein TA08995 [Theileria annulata]CAI76169.1 hypothetical protein TA08995 [Theileria annulata]|eukprot:XP_952795.1 hypothetical protein TA08995 [Theileria annulata]